MLAATACVHARLPAQDVELVVRPGPPAREDFEVDTVGDGAPDGWYNLRDARLDAGSGPDMSTSLKFENALPGRPARASRAFGVDGRVHEALLVGVWVRIDGIGGGDRAGEDPGLVIDFLDENLRIAARGQLGPWTRRTVPEGRWHHVAKRLPVPVESRDAILSVGLIGATGVLRIDGLTLELVPRGGAEQTNLVLNGDFELGDREPTHWFLTGGARRSVPGRQSIAALELTRSGARAQAGIAVPIRSLVELEVRLWSRSTSLRGAGGALGEVFFLDESGRVLPGVTAGRRMIRFAGSSSWRQQSATVRVPPGAARAALQFEKTDGAGSLWLDDLEVLARPDAAEARWRPFHVELDTTGWHRYVPAEAIEASSALDASTLLDTPAGKHGFVRVQRGRLEFSDGTPATFFGVALLPPLATLERTDADRLADDLARRGVNLARLVELDAPYGPGRSLLDDTAEDTSTFDPEALARFDYLVAALQKRGVYIAVELQAVRRFREMDQVRGRGGLPPGGGPAAAFDPEIRAVTLRAARRLLTHVNAVTGRPLVDEPALAWVTLSGEQSLFDLIDAPDLLPPESAALLRGISETRAVGTGRRLWQVIESEQWEAEARGLHALGLKVPIAGCSHWRREPEFAAAQAGRGLDLIEDRLYWTPPLFAFESRRGLVWQARDGLLDLAAKKRRGDRPYLVGQWAAHTNGLWTASFGGADLLLAATQASAEGWDALVRRCVFLHPIVWGEAPPGTSGGSDLFPITEVVNANPAVFSMLPHAASIFLRSPRSTDRLESTGGRARNMIWDPAAGRLVVDAPFTKALVGSVDRKSAVFKTLELEVRTTGATLAVTSLTREPIDTARRLLVTAVGRVEPTGQTYADACRSEPGFPGRGPILLEPVSGSVDWKRPGRVRAYALDSAGRRNREVEIESVGGRHRLVLDGRSSTLHWELVDDS